MANASHDASLTRRVAWPCEHRFLSCSCGSTLACNSIPGLWPGAARIFGTRACKRTCVATPFAIYHLANVYVRALLARARDFIYPRGRPVSSKYRCSSGSEDASKSLKAAFSASVQHLCVRDSAWLQLNYLSSNAHRDLTFPFSLLFGV